MLKNKNLENNWIRSNHKALCILLLTVKSKTPVLFMAVHGSYTYLSFSVKSYHCMTRCKEWNDFLEKLFQ